MSCAAPGGWCLHRIAQAVVQAEGLVEPGQKCRKGVRTDGHRRLVEQRFLRRQTRRIQDEIGASLPAQLGGPVDEARSSGLMRTFSDSRLLADSSVRWMIALSNGHIDPSAQ